MGDDETFQHMEHAARLERVTDLLIPVKDALSDRNVKRHLDDGLLRRIYMLRHSANIFREIPKRGTKNPGVYLIMELNTTINAAYLNIRGILDNLAWALAHHMTLKPNLSEGEKQHRSFVNLFSDGFLTAVAGKDDELGIRLRHKSTWGRDLSRRRDPAAHRIPMYVPPAAVSPAEAAEIQRQGAVALEKAKAGDRDAIGEYLQMFNTSGVFLPEIIISEQDEHVVEELFTTLNNDFESLLDTIETILVFQFIPQPSSSAHDWMCPPLPVREMNR